MRPKIHGYGGGTPRRRLRDRPDDRRAGCDPFWWAAQTWQDAKRERAALKPIRDAAPEPIEAYANLSLEGRHPSARKAPSSVEFVKTMREFDRIKRAATQAVIHPTGSNLAPWTPHPALERRDLCLRRVLEGEDMGGFLIEFMEGAGIAEGASRELREEMVMRPVLQAVAFRRIMRAENLSVRAELVPDEGCPAFHQDAVRARLILTLHGPGTEYCEAGEGGEDLFGAPYRGRGPVCQLATGSAAIFKGRLWREEERLRAERMGMAPPPPPLLHRSPPVAPGAPPRVLLVVDAA